MDLHDFEDVAENYDLYLDVMYRDQDNHAGFKDFYLDLAREYGKGGCIDIACGTGAVLLHLAQNGIDIEGTDLSEAMCRVSMEKAEKLGLELKIFPADMTDFRGTRKYSLAIIARSGFMHLCTPERQRAALLNIRDNLCDGGILTLNTFDPLPVFQAQQMQTGDTDYTFRLEYVNKHGQSEKIYNAISYDCITQTMQGNWKFETLDGNGNIIAERVRPLKMRQTYRQEMKYLAEVCGFEVAALYDGYSREPAKDDRIAKNLIWILRKV